MSNDSEELRFINNLSVLVAMGRPLRETLANMRKACQIEALLPAYDAMIETLDKGGDFTTVLGDYPQLCSRSSQALLGAARRSSCLAIVLPKLARLIHARVDGELDPRQRFLETWALLVECGFSTEAALGELTHDFAHGPLGEVAEGLRAAAQGGRRLASAAERFPEAFDAMSIDLLAYGEARDLPNALRAITRLI